jgi:16S rRNA (uracil1498-N3)-methyltransferase
MQRYFLEETPVGGEFLLPESVAHHLMTVLRGGVGTKAEFVYPDHETVVVGEVLAVEAENVRLRVIETRTSQVELPVQVTLILGLTKGDKPETVVQKGTELGATNFIFVETAWSVVHWGSKAARKIERLQKIAQGAAEQSHRLQVPNVLYVNGLSDLALATDAVKIVAWEESAKQGEQSALVTAFSGLKRGDEIAFLFGPEGGLQAQELDLLTDFGFVPAGLGPRILRAETAPLYALSALSYALELK